MYGARAFADALLAVLVASPCASCGMALDEPSRGPICEVCWHSIRPIPDPLCRTCGEPLAAWRSVGTPFETCPRCRRSRRSIDRGLAAGAFEGALRSAVHALKYDGCRSLAQRLGCLMRERGDELIRGCDAAVPVPLHPLRRMARGFNQADDLAVQLGLPVVRALRRTRATADQIGLPAARRHRNVRDAFGAHRRLASLGGGTVLLVDDVSTTGATLDACARVLKAYGVREVRALTAARVISTSGTSGTSGTGDASGTSAVSVR